MAEFSITEGVKSGFRLIECEPKAVLAWGGLLLAAALPQYAILFTHWSELARLDKAAVAAMENDAVGWNFLSLGLTSLAGFFIFAAIQRAILFPDDRRYFYLRVGPREGWMFVTSLASGALQLLLVAAFAVPIVLMLPADADFRHLPLPVVVLGAVAVVSSIWLAMRLSLAMPAAFAHRRFALGEGWRLSRGLALRLLGMGLATFGVLVGIVLVLSIVVVFFAALVAGLIGVASGDSFASFALPLFMAFAVLATILGSGLNAMAYAASWAPIAFVYRQLKEGDLS